MGSRQANSHLLTNVAQGDAWNSWPCPGLPARRYEVLWASPVTLDPEAKVGLCNLIPRAGHFQSRSSKLHAGWEVTMSYGQCLVVSDSLQRQGLQPARPLCPWDCPGKKTGVGCHFLLQGIFPTQGSNPGLPHCRQTLYPLRHQGGPM